jgi:N-acetyl-anhydromuramyl-L-alanine amidase AmpD
MSKSFKQKKRDVNLFVLHHDDALSSKSCYDILKRRNLSVQFSIDNDGTIYQFTDLNLNAQHAGSVNSTSVGVEISCAVNPKYQSYYKTKGFGERPVVTSNICNGKNYGKMLGFYNTQKDALKALIRVVCEFYNIPIQTPDVDGFYKPALDGKYRGVVGHYHVDSLKRKYDPIQLNLKEFIKTI